jgi:hypothetical protein
MGARGVIRFAAVDVETRLDYAVDVPLQALGGPPEITVVLNGREISRFQARTARLEGSLPIPATLLRRDPANELVISTSKTVVPAKAGAGSDQRRLGLRIQRVAISLRDGT